jgi:hypothetical protein
MEIESDSVVSFLGVLVSKDGTTLATKVYRKPTHTGRYFNFNSNHQPRVKRGLIQSLHNRASTICQERKDLVNEIISLRSDLKLSDYPQGFNDSVITYKLSEERGKTTELCVCPACEECSRNV